MSAPAPIIVWLRRDLRLQDNPAIAFAAAAGQPVIPLFIRSDQEKWSSGGAAQWWRGMSLAALRQALREVGSDLVLRAGDPIAVLRDIAASTGARRLAFNRSYEPADLRQDAEVHEAMGEFGVEVVEFPGNRLHEPWSVKTGGAGPYRVFTPFWRKLLDIYRPPPALPAPKALAAPRHWPEGDDLATVRRRDPWTASLAAHWLPGEAGASAALDAFVDNLVEAYGEQRDRPDVDGTSRLSPHLAWGEISVHEIWRRVTREAGAAGLGYLRELGWRDFNSHLFYHFPDLPHRPWSASFRRFPFVKNAAALRAWQRGRTGYPLVDAGMRQLWQTGWMHNRVRMVVGSFLVKDLLIDWRQGESWFWDTLVDADLAQNAGNWQWVAGCGADAAPFFRIFNPTTQGEKFDPQGAYIRRWVPELAALPADCIHQPSAAAPLDLAGAGVVLGKTYPWPIVDHAKARSDALTIYRTLSGKAPRDD